MEPVKKSEAPDYYEVIRFPIGEDAHCDPSFHFRPHVYSCFCLTGPHGPVTHSPRAPKDMPCVPLPQT